MFHKLASKNRLQNIYFKNSCPITLKFVKAIFAFLACCWCQHRTTLHKFRFHNSVHQFRFCNSVHIFRFRNSVHQFRKFLYRFHLGNFLQRQNLRLGVGVSTGAPFTSSGSKTPCTSSDTSCNSRTSDIESPSLKPHDPFK